MSLLVLDSCCSDSDRDSSACAELYSHDNEKGLKQLCLKAVSHAQAHSTRSAKLQGARARGVRTEVVAMNGPWPASLGTFRSLSPGPLYHQLPSVCRHLLTLETSWSLSCCITHSPACVSYSQAQQIFSAGKRAQFLGSQLCDHYPCAHCR